MKRKSNEVKNNLILLSFTLISVLIGILFLYGTAFFEDDVEILGFGFGPFEVTYFVISVFMSFVFGTKAYLQNFGSVSTNIILAAAIAFASFVVLKLWNDYNEIQEALYPFHQDQF